MRLELFVREGRGKRAASAVLCGTLVLAAACSDLLAIIFRTNAAISSRSPSSFIAAKALTDSNHRASRSRASGHVPSCGLTIIRNTRTSHGMAALCSYASLSNSAGMNRVPAARKVQVDGRG